MKQGALFYEIALPAYCKRYRTGCSTIDKCPCLADLLHCTKAVFLTRTTLGQRMMEQAPHQARVPHRFKPGNPGRPTVAEKRARILARATEFALPLGGLERLDAIERTLIEQAAELSLRRPRRQDELVRTANIVNRILRDVLRRHKPADASRRSELGDYLKTRVPA
jgi:hypothetical protein